MNAIYHECVNERKKNFKNVVDVEPTIMCLLVHCSTIFTTHSLPLIKQIFILKVNHAQFKQNNYKMWKAGREPWTFGYPAFYSTT
jgi:hypothetical protein